MRFIFGVIVGALLTVVGVYAVDQGAAQPENRPMVNWDVVGEKVAGLTEEAQKAWADFTREVTGPQ